MADIFGDLAKAFQGMQKDLTQITEKSGWRSTVIVHPQLSKSNDDAQDMATNWKKREEKQLFENLSKRLR